MTSTKQTPLLTMLAEAFALGQALITVMQREAEALNGKAGDLPADLLTAKADFLASLTKVLAVLSIDPSVLQGSAEMVAFNALQTLIAQMGTTSLDSLIEAHPETVDFCYERAGIMFSQGRLAEASQDYLAVLNKQPRHFGALNDYAVLLTETGQFKAARHYFSLAVSTYPKQIDGHLNFADFLLGQCDYATAKTHYQTVLELAPKHAAAHQGLSLALAGLGDQAGANLHRDMGFRDQAVLTWPKRGAEPGIPLLILSSAFGGNIPIKHLLDNRKFEATVILSEYFATATPLPPHKLLINLIGDADLCPTGLDIAESLLTGYFGPVINHPARIRSTGRLENAQRLGALPDVTTPNISLLSRTLLMTDQAESLLSIQNIGFPLLLRSPGFHTGLHFVRVETFGELARIAGALPGDDLLAMQLLDARNQHGDSHKFRVMFVDGVLYPLHLAISRQWKVHYFSADMDLQPEHRALEAAFLENMPQVLGDKAIAALERIRQTLGLDYGGIDFALDRDGGILLFEANATMAVHRPEDKQKWAYRQTATERIIAAVRTMLLKRSIGSD
jgi:tetratricopeptide (TPR) repeat protein